MGKTGRCFMLSSCCTKLHVLISVISGEVLFNHTWRSTCFTTAGQIPYQTTASSITGGQLTTSIAAGHELHPLQVVNFIHCSWSTTCSISGCQLLFPLQLVNYFVHCSWSNTCSIAGGQLLPLQLVNYFFYCSW